MSSALCRHVLASALAAALVLAGCGDDGGDTTPPAVTVDTLSRWDATPDLTGTVDDATATVTVTVDGQVNVATNNGDGTWTLAGYTLTALAPGTYDVAVTATDAAGNVGADATTSELTIFTFTDIGAGLAGVYECALAWGDHDNDGDLDLALAGYPGSLPDISKVYRNDGGTFTAIGAGLTRVGYSSLAWGDYDNDGDLDLALAGYSIDEGRVSKVYRNDGGTFTAIGAGLTGVDVCSLAWGDYDNDGDLDLALAGDSGSWDVSKVYRNDGGTFTAIGAGLTGVSYCSLAWGDYDNDGDLDLAIAGWPSSGPVSKVYRNDGGTFTDIGAGLTRVGDSSLAWGDYDNDGDLDLALAGYSIWPDNVVTKVYRNDGGTFTDIGAGLTRVGYSSLAWGDYDNDGDLDLALAGDAGWPDNVVTKVYRNDGGTFTNIGAGLMGVVNCSLAWGDHDNDGDLDLALAGQTAGFNYVTKVYRNDGGVFNTAAAAPAGLGATCTGTGPYDVTFSWDSATDAQTAANGLSHNLRVGTTSGGNDIFSGMADVATGLRRIPARGAAQPGLSENEWTLTLPAGTYSLYWSVQAVDTGFMGGAWATEETLTVP